MAIHPSAVISDGAVIGEEVEIGPFSVIGDKVTIGDGCKIGSHCRFDGTTTIGPKNTFGSFCAIGAAAQDLGYDGREAFLTVGTENLFGDYVQLCRGTIKSGDLTTRIGNKNFFMANAHAGHDVQVGDRCTLANGVLLAGHVELEGNVTIGGAGGVHQFCVIGRYVMVGGIAAVNGHVTPFVRASGMYGDHISGLNTVGLQRSGEFTPEDIRIVKDVYRLFFRDGGNFKESLAAIRAKHGGNRHADYFCAFLERMQTSHYAKRPISRPHD